MLENDNKKKSNFLPNTWILVEIKDIGEIVSGGTPSTKNPEYWGNDISWITPVDLSGYVNKTISRGKKSLTQLGYDNSSAKLMPTGSILFSSRAPIGYVVIAGNELSTNQGFKSLIPYRCIYNEYVYYYLKSAINLAKKRASGTTFLELSSKEFGKIPIPLAPLNEQYRIVAKIEELFSELDQGIESLKKAKEQLKIYRQAVLKSAFEGKLTEDWRTQQLKEGKLESAEFLLEKIKLEREKYYQQQLEEWEQSVKLWEVNGKEGKKPSKPKKMKEIDPLSDNEIAELPQLPKKWSWFRFYDLIYDEPQNGLYKPENCYGEGTLIVRVDNFYEGILNNWLTFKRLELDKNELKKYQINQGDILINRVNSMSHLGKCSLVYKIPEPCVFESNIMKLKVIHSLCKAQFITYYLSSMLGLKQLRKNAKQAVNQASINQKDVTSVPIPICSLSEQNKIVEEIESRFTMCDILETSINESLQKAEALRQSILKQAFEGKLVPQDPKDEPAEKLLERIKIQTNKVKIN